MYVLNKTKVNIGDIIITSSKEIVSKTIRTFTKSDFSHAMLVVDDSCYIHSNNNGVHAGNLSRLLFKDKNDVKVLRLIDVTYIEKACEFARYQIGKEYSVKEAIGVKIPILKERVCNRQFCSRLVAQAYEYAGKLLVKNSNYCSPQEILDSPHTYVIDNCTMKISDSEVEDIKNNYLIDLQNKLTNHILKKSRELTGCDIQTFDDLYDFVINHIKYDKQLSKIVKDSGYLSIWDNRYEEIFNLLDKYPFELLKDTIKITINAKTRYYKNLENELFYFINYGIELAKINVDLYSKLIKACEKIIDKASKLIENYKEQL